MTISLLPEDVYSRIAAGEVIERPSSVVKEAVENAIDADATEVTVSLTEGGKVRIVVEDDGRGISFDDLPLAVARYATSKIRTVEELEALASLGFRGEALASIAAVSRLEIRSRVRGDEEGALLRIEGGSVLQHARTSAQQGTRVSAEDLFYTLPARRKFMKSAAAEARRAMSLVRDFAVAYPSIAFVGRSDGKKVFSSAGDGDKESLFRQMWGAGDGGSSFAAGGDIRMCEATTTNMRLECWWMPFPGKTRSLVSAFVNGRIVNDPLIKGAAAVLSRTMTGNWALFFTLPPELLDANIHPAKAEVRFRYPGEIFDAVQQATLLLSGRPSSLSPRGATVFPTSIDTPSGHSRQPLSFPRERTAQEEDLFNRVASVPFPESTPVAESASTEDRARFLAVMGSGYVVFEVDDSLAVMDPHAAHERIRYERLRDLSDRPPVTQRCMVPIPLPPSFSMSVREHSAHLEEVGFVFQESDGLLHLTAFPSLQKGMDEDPVRLLRSVLLEWTEDIRRPLKEVLWRRLATIACGQSVKLGGALSPEECAALWRDLNQCEQPWTCPHGRPTVLTLSRNKLESFFGRE